MKLEEKSFSNETVGLQLRCIGVITPTTYVYIDLITALYNKIYSSKPKMHMTFHVSLYLG